MSSRVIDEERAERIARAHGCVRCGERNYKRVKVVPVSGGAPGEFEAAWRALLRCGVCGVESEVGLDAEGDVLYAH